MPTDCTWLSKKAVLVAVLTAAMLFPCATRAVTMVEESFTCPIGGEVFIQPVIIESASDYLKPMGDPDIQRQLDLKPVGPIDAPLPIPECPGNGYLIFDAHLTEAQLAILAPVIASAEYQTMRRRESSYYRKAHLERALGRPAHEIAWTLLVATWQVEGDQYQRYAEKALAEYRKAFRQPPDPTFTAEEQDSSQFLVGELLRRLGRFEEAQAHMQGLLKRFDPEHGAASLVRQSLQLIADRTSRVALIKRPEPAPSAPPPAHPAPPAPPPAPPAPSPHPSQVP